MGTGTEIAIASLTTGMVAEWAQPSRQQLLRSHAAELLGNDAPVDEVRAALTDEVRGTVAVALAGWREESAPAIMTEEGTAALAIALGRYIALTGTHMNHDARQEWIDVAIDELGEFPLAMVIDAVKRARRSEPFPGKLVAFVCGQIEAKAERLKAEGAKLMKLADLC